MNSMMIVAPPRPVSVSFTNEAARPGKPPPPIDYSARREQMTGALPAEICDCVYFLPTQAGSEGDGQDFDFVDPVKWNRMLMEARPDRVGVYTGLGEARNAGQLTPGSPALRAAVRAFRGSSCVIFDKSAYPQYLARTIPILREFALAGIRVGFEANADSPEVRAFLAEFPGTMIAGESWLWTEKYLKNRLSAAAVRALGGMPCALVNRRVARQGTVGWIDVREEDWPDMKISLAEAFVGQGMRVILRPAGIDPAMLEVAARLGGVA